MNGYSEFFEKIDLFSRNSIIAMLILTVFWYAGMAMGARDSFALLDLPLQIAVAFCLAVYWICFQTIFVKMTSVEAKRQDSNDAITRNAATQSIIFLGALFVIHIGENMRLERFIFITYMYFLVMAAVFVVVVHFSHRLAGRSQATR